MNTLGCALLLLLTAAAARASVTVTRTSSDHPHPSTMELEVALPDSRQKLLIPLTRSTAFDNIPITVLESGVSRRFSSRQVRHPSHSHYTHADSSSVVSVRLVDGNRRMSGHVMHEGVSYSLEPDGESGHRVVRKEASPRVAELVGKRMASSRLRRVVSRRRRQSSTSPTTYVVELYLMLDHTVWFKMKKLFRSESATMTELNFYYTHILNGIDTVYRNIPEQDFISISISCIGITISKTPADSNWMPPKSVDAGDILAALSGVTFDQAADHIMAFTRKDLTANGTEATGVAYPSGVCKESYRTSVIGDNGLHSWGTAAHELGHNLGADHDGEGNSCPESDKFLLAPAPGLYSPNDVANSYRFSTCSASSITKLVKSLGPTNCLLKTDGRRLQQFSSGKRAGARMNLDMVCRLTLLGKSKGFVPTEDVKYNPATICASIACESVGGKLESLPELRAPVGTPCGDRKSCNWNGECTPDEAAPAADDACFWGDLWKKQVCAKVKRKILMRQKPCTPLFKRSCCKTLAGLALCDAT